MQDFFKIPLTGGIIILGLTWIFTFHYNEKVLQLISKPTALAFIAFYLLHLLSILYTENLTIGWNDMRLKITLLLLPLFMMTTQLFTQLKRLFLLRLFAGLMVLMAGVDLALSCFEYLSTSNSAVFFYKNLPHLLASKPHYASWYYAFALFIILNEIVTHKKWRRVWILGFSLVLLSLIFLSSRAYMIAFMIVFALSFVKWASYVELSKLSWIKVSLAFFLLIGTLFVLPQTRSRIKDTLVEIEKLSNEQDYRQTNPRVYLWSYGASLIGQSPLFGYGLGDATAELQKALKGCDAKFWDGEKNVPIHAKKLNYHNQFLQTWAEVGILGFLLLAFLMIRPFFLKNQHPLFLIFVGLTLIGFLTESMLERQAGVVLLAFMYPLLSDLKK